MKYKHKKTGQIVTKGVDGLFHSQQGGYTLQRWIFEDSNDWQLVIENAADFEPKKPWEIYPDFKSTVKPDKEGWAYSLNGAIEKRKQLVCYPYVTSEVIAKRQLAEIQLMAIAEAWNDITLINGTHSITMDQYTELNVTRILGVMTGDIYFVSKELAEKSLELHKELWNDYYCI